MKTPVVLAVDGNSLAHRAYHAYEKSNMRNSQGEAVWATYGFFSLLGGICDKVNPDAIVVGFDDHTKSFRKDRCQEYKAQREAKSFELYQQIADIIEILRLLEVTVVVPPGLEADDVVGSVAKSAEDLSWKCIIATSDRDSFALITKDTTVLRLVSGLDNAIWADEKYLEERYGVSPSQYLEYAAIRGDTSDNLPGVKGVGEKTAAKLLKALGSLGNNLQEEELLLKIVGKSVAAKLMSSEAAANIKRNIDIMTILRDIPVDIEKSRLNAPQELVRKVFLEKELPNLVNRLSIALSSSKTFSTQDVFRKKVSDDAPFNEELFNESSTGNLEPDSMPDSMVADSLPDGLSDTAKEKKSAKKTDVFTLGKGALRVKPKTTSQKPMGFDRSFPESWPRTL